MMMTDLGLGHDFAWVDTLPGVLHRGGGRGVSPEWARIAIALREHPGQFAQVRVFVPCDPDSDSDDEYGHKNPQGAAAAIANRIRNGALKAFEPAGDFEAYSRKLNNGYGVFVRYVGNGYADSVSDADESAPPEYDPNDPMDEL